MPNYADGTYFTQRDTSTFNQVFAPGTPAPASGIYRCDACGFEASSTVGHPLPPARDCGAHGARWRCARGHVRWRLVAAAIHTNN